MMSDKNERNNKEAVLDFEFQRVVKFLFDAFYSLIWSPMDDSMLANH